MEDSSAPTFSTKAESGKRVSRREALAYVFVAGFCLMVIELVAGRIIAPYLGSSLYTWTGVIGVVLLGMSLGNYAGGSWAEKGAGWKSVSVAFALSGLAAVLSYYTYLPASELVYGLGLPIVPATFTFALLGFFPVSFLLSLVTPIVITRTLPSLERAGTTIGQVYAVSSLASIFGTFTAGYVLIPFFGIRTIVLAVAAVLLLAAIVVSRGGAVRRRSVQASVILLWSGLLGANFCDVDSAYYCINIYPAVSERGEGYKFVLDRLTHSFFFADPSVLEYDYETVYGVAAEYAQSLSGGQSVLRTLNIGGGGYTMPRFVAATYPEATVDVIEIDPAVTEVNESRLGLNPDGRIRTFNEDARVFFARGAGEDSYDIIFGDAFDDYSVPYHLTTVEFARQVREKLSPDGIYVLNMIDDSSDGRLLGSFLRTLNQVFPEIRVSAVGQPVPAPVRGTFVILASTRPLDIDRWHQSALAAFTSNMSSPQSLTLEQAGAWLSSEQVGHFIDKPGSVLLTDDYAPVDSLVAPLSGRRL